MIYHFNLFFRKFFLSFVFFVFSSFFCLAQKVIFKGKIVDESDTLGIPFALVKMNNFKDSSFITGVSADENGSFLLKLDQKGNYILKIQSLGYEIVTRNILIEMEEQNIGTIFLRKNAVGLHEVIVSAQKNLITKKIDRLVFDVENSTLTKGKSGWEALSSIPNLITDNEGIISIPGKKAVSLLIDNRRINLSPQELKIYLESISAEDISSIEIITTPSSEYDAEGIGGIVRIVTKKTKEKGLKGTVRAGIGKSTFFNQNMGVTLNYNTGKFNILTGYSYNNGRYRQIDDGTVETPFSFRKIYNKTDRKQQSSSGKIGLDYQVSKKHFLGILGEAGVTNVNREFNVNTTFFKPPYNDVFIDKSDIVEKNSWQSFNLNYNGLWFSSLDVKINADYLNYDSDKEQNMMTADQIYEGHSTSIQNIAVKSSKIDLSYPLFKGNIEMGWKLSQMHTSSDFQIDFNPALINLQDEKDYFLYTECIQALYASIYLPIGEKWKFKLGARMENTRNEANSIILMNIVKRNYVKVFPVGYLEYTINDNNSVNLSIGRRINRPGYFDLNPFRYYSSPYSYAEGNPFLQPYFIYTINLDYTFRKNYGLGLYYQFIDNPFSQLPEQGDSSNELRYIRKNVADQYVYGINVVLPFTIKNWWNLQGVIDGKIPEEKFTYLTQDVINKKAVVYIGLNNTFMLFKDIRIDIKGWYNSPQKNFIYTSQNSVDLSIGIAKDFWKKKINISFSVSDIFKTNPMKTEVNIEEMKANYNNKWDSRFFKIAASYSFGKKTIKEAKKREKSNIEEIERLK